ESTTPSTVALGESARRERRRAYRRDKGSSDVGFASSVSCSDANRRRITNRCFGRAAPSQPPKPPQIACTSAAQSGRDVYLTRSARKHLTNRARYEMRAVSSSYEECESWGESSHRARGVGGGLFQRGIGK